jgi:WD40 repeat protein
LDGSGERVVLTHTGLKTIALSPDGQWATTGSFPRRTTVKVWEARTGRLVADLPVPTNIMEFTPDGQWLVTGYGTGYRFWKAATWAPGIVIPTTQRRDSSLPMAFSMDGRLMAIAQEGRTIELRDPTDGRMLATLASSDTGYLQSLRFSHDGRWLAAVRWTQTIQLWDIRELRQQLKHMRLDWD